MKFSRRMAGLFVLALLDVAVLAPGAVQAHRSSSALKVFSDTHFGYRLTYPATWSRSPSTNLDVLLLAPDSDARLGGKGIDAGLSASDVRKTVDSTISQLSGPTTAILRTTRVIHGVTFQMARATFTVNGVSELAMTLGASRHQRTYLFFGIVGLAKPAAHLQAPHGQEELGQLQASFASITLAR